MEESVTGKNKWLFSGNTALLVEDNDLVHELVREIMKRVGISIDVCVNGLEALHAVQEKSYDIILMDIQMPIMDGLEATRQIRHLGGKMTDLPIIAMSANSHSEDVEMGHRAGISAYLGKPINKEMLYETIALYLKNSVNGESYAKQANEHSSNLPELEGVDTDDGVQRMAGNIKAYFSTLRNFFKKYEFSSKAIETFLQQGDFEPAERLTHGIKGNAGNIGAKELHLCASSLERACHNRSMDTAMSLFPEFKNSLIMVLGSLKSLPEEESSEKVDRQDFDQQKWLLAAKDYLTLLDDDYGSAMDALANLKCLAGDEYIKEMLDLERHIENFDVDSARQILTRIINK